MKDWLKKLLGHNDEVSIRRVIALVTLILISILSIAALWFVYDMNLIWALVTLCASAAGLSQINKGSILKKE